MTFEEICKYCCERNNNLSLLFDDSDNELSGISVSSHIFENNAGKDIFIGYSRYANEVMFYSNVFKGNLNMLVPDIRQYWTSNTINIPLHKVTTLDLDRELNHLKDNLNAAQKDFKEFKLKSKLNKIKEDF